MANILSQRPFIPLAIGLLIGLVAGLGLARRDLPGDARRGAAGEHDSGAVSVRDSNAALAGLREQLDRLEKENTELRKAVEEGARTSGRADAHGPVAFSIAGEPNGEKLDAEKMIERMRRGAEHFADMQLDRYQGRLNLTEAQRQALRDIMVLQQERIQRLMFARHNGEDPKSLGFEQVSDQDILDLAKEVLSPSQYDEYSRIRDDERKSRNDMMATARLGQLAPMLDLSEEQKDRIYSLFYSEADQMGDFPDPEAMLGNQTATDEAIGKILTEEQRKAYQDYRERQAKGGAAGMFFIGG